LRVPLRSSRMISSGSVLRACGRPGVAVRTVLQKVLGGAAVEPGCVS